MQKTCTHHRNVLLTLCFLFFAGIATAQNIYRHDFGTTTISGKPYNVPPVTLAAGLSNSSWTTSADGFVDFNGATGKALSLSSTTSVETYTLTFDVAPGYVCNITSFNLWRTRSTTGPNTLSMAINGVNAGGSMTIPATTGSNVGLTPVSGFHNLTGTVSIVLTLTGGSGGTFRLDDFVLVGSVLQPDIQSAQSGYWNDGSTWVGGVVPAPNQTVLIQTNHTVRLNVSGLQRPTFVNGGFQLETGSSVQQSGNNFIYGPQGTLLFNTNGPYGVNEGDIYWPWNNGPVHVTVLQGAPLGGGGLYLNNLSRIINGTLSLHSGVAVNSGQYLRVNGTCQINPGGWVTDPLQYGPASTLIYNTNTNPYNNGKEWTSTSNPTNVVLKNNTVLNYPAVGAGNRILAGDLTIEAGSALYMDYGTPSGGSGSLTIRNLHLRGSISLGNQIGDDLKTTGDLHFYSGYSANFNNRAVFFIKDGAQTVNTPSYNPITIPYVVIGRPGGSGTTAVFNQDISISAPSTGNAISFINSADVLNFAKRTLTIGTPGMANQITGPGSFVGDASSKMILLGAGSVGTVRFSGSNELAELTVNRTAAQVGVTLGSNVTIHTALALSNGHIQTGAYNLSLRPGATISGGGSNSFIQVHGTGKLERYFNSTNVWITLPVGGLSYSPMRYQVTNGTINTNNTYLSVNLAESRHPQNTASTSYIKRYWNTAVQGLTNYTADAEFHYLTSDVTSTESAIISGAYDGSNWQMDNPANTTSHFVSFTGTDNLQRSFTGGNTFSPLASHPNNYFRSRATGNWNAPATWESSYNQTVWNNATLAPTSQAKGINIRGSHTVSLTADATARSLTVEAGGTLTNTGSTGGYALSITDDGTSTDDFTIYGTYILLGKQPTLNAGATVRVFGGGVVRANDNYSGGSDDFARDSRVHFETNSIFDWNTTNAFQTGGVVYFPNGGPTDIPIFKISKSSGGAATTVTINGILDVRTNFVFSGGASQKFRNGITGNSTLKQTGGQFFIDGVNAVLGGNGLTLELSSQMNLNSSVLIPKDSSVIIRGYGISNNADGNILTVSGVLDATDITITNTANKTLIIEETGLFRTVRDSGFTNLSSSAVGSGGIVTLKPGSTIELYGTGNQKLFSRGDFSNLIFSGSGIKTFSTTVLPQGTITIKDNAILDSRGYNIGDVNTNLTMLDNSRLIVNTIGRNPAIDGVYNLQGGVIQFDNKSGTKQTIRGTTGKPINGTSVIYNQIEVTGSSVGHGSGHVQLGQDGKFTVKSGATYEVNQQSIKGAAGTTNHQVVIESVATFKTGNEFGFHGKESNVIPIGVSSINPNITNIVLQPNSTVDYHRSSALSAVDQTITTTFPYQNLILSGDFNKIADANSTIEIKGNLTKTGNAVFVHNDGSIIFNGTGAQTYKSSYPQMVFNNLTNLNTSSLSIEDSASVLRALTLGANSKLDVHADITLQSNAVSTANVAEIPGTARINYHSGARFIVERYIPAHPKAWQFITTPVVGPQTIHQSWMEGMNPGMSAANNAPGAPGNLKPGYGTTITSDRTTWQADGFDRFTQPGPSLKTFNSSTGKWEGVSSTNNPVQSSKGYMLFVRGDRSIIDHATPANATTLRSRGQLYAPGYAAPSPILVPFEPGQFVSVGNPYASAVDFNNVSTTNVAQAYIIWDPQLTTAPSAYGLGAYRTISGNVAVPSSGNYQSGNTPPIQSGQAFFVQLASSAVSAGQVSFSESSKTSGSRSIFRKETLPDPDASLRMNLFSTSNGQPVLLDGNLIQYQSTYPDALDEWDVRKMMNPAENIGILSNQQVLAIERKEAVEAQDTIFYKISGFKKHSYQLEIISERMDYTGLKPYLWDTFTDTHQELYPSGSTWYSFEVTDKAASNAADRFKILFRSAQGPLPVTITAFTAEKQGEKALLKWTTANESGIKSYILEKSADRNNFKPIYTVAARNNASDTYGFADQISMGSTYYRLRIQHQNDSYTYSHIIRIDQAAGQPALSLYPNPVTDGKIRLRMLHQPEGAYRFRLLNTTGQQLLSTQVQYAGEEFFPVFDISTYPGGMYYLDVSGPGTQPLRLPVFK